MLQLEGWRQHWSWVMESLTDEDGSKGGTITAQAQWEKYGKYADEEN